MGQRIEVNEHGTPDKVLGSLKYETVVREVDGLHSSYGPGGFGIGVVPVGKEGRQETGGPMIAGPWGYLYGRSAVIDNYGGTGAEHKTLAERGLLIERVADGDVLVLDGFALVVKVERDRVRLVPEEERGISRYEPTRVREHGTHVTAPRSADERIAAIRDVVERGAYAKVDGVALDLTTAGAIIAVYDALSETNRARFAAFRVDQMARMAWKLVR